MMTRYNGYARWTALCLALLWCYRTVRAFNVDTESAVVHRGPTGAMFGFAVSLHRDNGNSWLLIGAPKAQTDQPEVERGGAVYKCSPDAANACQQIPFDRTGPTKVPLRGRLEQTDQKSDQWFGATVYSSGENGMIVACAPRYVYFSTNLRRRDPVGTCWTSRSSFSAFQEYAPCRTSQFGHNRLGSCQAGFSAAITKNGKRLFLGAVGSFYWQGQVFSQDLFSRQSLTNTAESPVTDDDSYLGYSTATGEFNGDNDPDVVVGIPRGNTLSGKVALYNSSLSNLVNITGEQMGSYFGYCICVSDVNGDGLDDIIIGAPLYTDSKSKDSTYEKGRVYVVYQNKNHNFDRKTPLDGEQSKGRFGMSLSSLKDINRDGFQDFAVGAPYGGPDGNGVVYIYHGTKEGVMKKPSQSIFASVFGDPLLRTFGFSISGGLDTDNNEYPDLLIGAYDSDKAVFLRSRPVVTVKASLKLDPEKVSLDSKSCSLKDGKLVSCVVVSLCLEYSGVSVGPEMGFRYKTTLDSKQQTHRRSNFLLNETLHETSTFIRLRKEAKYCNSLFIYLKSDLRDKLTPITVEVNYELMQPFQRGFELAPILNNDTVNVLTKQLHIVKNCGKDNICIPDLRIQTTPNMDQYLLGTKKRLELDVKISNHGEDAFEAMMYLSMPVEVSYVNIDKTKLQDYQISCSGADPDRSGVNELVCDIGNPLPANKTLNFKVLLAPSRITSKAASNFHFKFEVNSTNAENKTTMGDNKRTITLPVRVEVDLQVEGVSKPTTVSFNASDSIPENLEYVSDIGPEIIHTYRIDNKGPSVVKETVVHLLWPTYTLNNDHLLYLVEQPAITGNAKCEDSPANPLRLKLSSKKKSTGTKRINEISSNVVEEEAEAVEETETILRERRYIVDEELTDELTCGTSICTKIRCTVTNLRKEKPVIFTLKSRMWKNTITKMNQEEVIVQSKIVAKVLKLPYDVDPSYLGIQTYWVKTLVNVDGLERGFSSIPLWIILLAVCGGLLVLGLLALLLWRLGFFKRKRPQEEEPLYRAEKNGYQLAKGDEAL